MTERQKKERFTQDFFRKKGRKKILIEIKKYIVKARPVPSENFLVKILYLIIVKGFEKY